MPKKTVHKPETENTEKVKPEIVAKVAKKRVTKSVKPRVKKSESNEDIVVEGDFEVVLDKKDRMQESTGVVVQRRKYNLGGRPTKYKEEYADMLLDYFSSGKQEVYVDRVYYDRKEHVWNNTTYPDSDGHKRHLVKSETHRILKNTVPTLARFAFMLDVSTDTLYEWATYRYPIDYKPKKLAGCFRYPRFSVAYARAKKLQEAIIIEGAMSKDFDSQFAKFVLINNHGYVDRTENANTNLDLIVPVTQLSPEKRAALEYSVAQQLLPPNN